MTDETKAPSERPERPAGDAPREFRPSGDRPRFGGGGGRSGPGGPPREGGRKFFRRKKVCKFCTEKIADINYKDYRLLGQFVAESGKI
ncbi:MAG: 30S ribosomal protein S18, partial [Candidatus Sulfotelmatobacter sp.]